MVQTGYCIVAFFRRLQRQRLRHFSGTMSTICWSRNWFEAFSFSATVVEFMNRTSLLEVEVGADSPVKGRLGTVDPCALLAYRCFRVANYTLKASEFVGQCAAER